MHHGTIPPCGWELACAISSARDARSRHHDDCRAVPTRPSAVAPDRALPRGCRGSLEPALSLMSCQLSSATRLTTGRPAGRSTDRGPCVARRVYTRLSLLSSRPAPRDRFLAIDSSRPTCRADRVCFFLFFFFFFAGDLMRVFAPSVHVRYIPLSVCLLRSSYFAPLALSSRRKCRDRRPTTVVVPRRTEPRPFFNSEST